MVNETRSLNQDLHEGITDGMVKKINPNRGGFPNDDHCMMAVYNSLSEDLYDPVPAPTYPQRYFGLRHTTLDDM